MKKRWTLDEIQKTVFVMQNKIVIKNYFYLFYGKFNLVLEYISE